MAAVIQGYMGSDILKTPGFFTAAIAADNENPFDISFKNENRDGFQLDRQQNGNFFAHNMNGDPFSPLFAFSNKNQYPNPLLHQQIPSPPHSAKQVPSNWPCDEIPNLQAGKPAPHTIATLNHPKQTRLRYGQVTPPDDVSPEIFDYRNPRIAYQHNAPLQTQTLQSGDGGKRKRSSGSNNDPSKPSKRPRKYICRSKSNAQHTDLTNPEDEKRSKFLERNRVAASKCRQKKKEWTSNLEARARDLQNSKNQLALMVNSLKDEMMFLKGEMLKHTSCGCKQIREYLSKEANNIATGSHHAYTPFESAASPVGSAPNSRLGSVSASSPPRRSRRESLTFDFDEPNDTQPHRSPQMHFKSENELEALLTNQLGHDTSNEGIASQSRK